MKRQNNSSLFEECYKLRWNTSHTYETVALFKYSLVQTYKMSKVIGFNALIRAFGDALQRMKV